MRPPSLDLIPRLRAALVALALLAGPVYASASIAIASSDVCSMSCCISEGHCCCTPRHARVAGEITGGQARIAQAELSRRCPAECAAGRTSTPSFARQLQSAPPAHDANAEAAAIARSRAVYAINGSYSEVASPRGPPADFSA
jgi:hypothetical protein